MKELGEERSSTLVGFTCAYTPLPLIRAAGLTPYRMLPMTDAQDEAGAMLHDNMCPHVKRILDRGVADELPPLSGVVFVNSCDAMRRLADAWSLARPDDPMFLLDLPPTVNPSSIRYFAAQLEGLTEQLESWTGHKVSPESISEAIEGYNLLAHTLEDLEERARTGALPSGYPALQELRIQSVTRSPEETLERARKKLDEPPLDPPFTGVPLYLVGNVFPDPAAYELLESCGALLVGDDLCTGGRQLGEIPPIEGDDVHQSLAQAVLSRPPCSRTFRTDQPGAWADEIVAHGRSRGARGVIVHIVKFCDPYLVRLPGLRAALDKAGLPLLVLEGDCTLRSLGQHRTRIEAFVEMLGGVS